MKRAFTFVVLAWFTAVVAVVAAGCQKKAETASVNPSVTDVGSAQPQAQQPAVAQQPVVEDTFTPAAGAAVADANGGGGMLPGGTYTVKKGDTLYGIARQRYGDGKQWVRIAEANPGLRPEALKAGQTITVP